MQDFINELHKRNAPTEIIVGYEFENELTFQLDQKPLSLSSGTIQTASDVYDMSSQKELAMSANLVNWSNQVSDAIKQVEPTALTTISFTSPIVLAKQKFATKNTQIVSTFWIFVDSDKGGSSIDFVDLHLYPAAFEEIVPCKKKCPEVPEIRSVPISVDDQMNAYQITSNKKPIILGEFGLSKDNPTLETPADFLLNWQVSSCTYPFQGWLTWAWDQAAKITNYWSVDENDGAINQVMAPIYRANPCKAEKTLPTPTPPSLPPPVGYLGEVSCTIFNGWAGDTSNVTRSVDVHFYADGSNFLGMTTAALPREKAVCDANGSTENPCNHGFVFNTPVSLKDGKSHTIDVYAISPDGFNPKLTNSGKTITCPATNPGDLNSDGKVDIFDYNILIGDFGKTGSAGFVPSDIDNNGKVDIFDYNLLVSNYGK